jgi:hypothetical protein
MYNLFFKGQMELDMIIILLFVEILLMAIGYVLNRDYSSIKANNNLPTYKKKMNERLDFRTFNLASLLCKNINYYIFKNSNYEN